MYPDGGVIGEDLGEVGGRETIIRYDKKSNFFKNTKSIGIMPQIKVFITINIICATFSLDFLFGGLLLNHLLRGSTKPESRRLM